MILEWVRSLSHLSILQGDLLIITTLPVGFQEPDLLALLFDNLVLPFELCLGSRVDPSASAI